MRFIILAIMLTSVPANADLLENLIYTDLSHSLRIDSYQVPTGALETSAVILRAKNDYSLTATPLLMLTNEINGTERPTLAFMVLHDEPGIIGANQLTSTMSAPQITSMIKLATNRVQFTASDFGATVPVVIAPDGPAGGKVGGVDAGGLLRPWTSGYFEQEVRASHIDQAFDEGRATLFGGTITVNSQALTAGSKITASYCDSVSQRPVVIPLVSRDVNNHTFVITNNDPSDNASVIEWILAN